MNIRALFFPDHLYNYYLFPTQYSSIVITANAIRAVIIRAHRNQRFIEKSIEQPINLGEGATAQERTETALRLVIDAIPDKTSIIAVLPSTQVIFKIITIPLMSLAKIKMIIPFEIESSLPFSSAGAAIDCIIIDQNKTTKTAQVLVAATKRSLIEEHLALYKTISYHPQRIVTDAIALCALYTSNYLSVPALQEAVVLINIEDAHSTVLLGNAHAVYNIRVLPYSIGNPSFTEQAINTIQSFVSNTQPQMLPKTLLFCGSSVDKKEFKDIAEGISQTVAIPWTLLSANKVVHSATIHSTLSLTNNLLIPIAAALPQPALSDFNLDQISATQTQQQAITHQVTTSLVIIVALFTLFAVARFVALHTIRTEIELLEKETIEKLKTELHLAIPKSSASSLDAVNNQARTDVINKEVIWFSLSSPNRFSPLRILEELSKHINRDELGLQLQRIIISEDSETMLLEGSVKDFAALRKLEENLRQSPLFKQISNMQDLNFIAKISLDIGGNG